MGKRKTSIELIKYIQGLQRKGFSLNEIHSQTTLGYGTVYKYIKDIEILPEFMEL